MSKSILVKVTAPNDDYDDVHPALMLDDIIGNTAAGWTFEVVPESALPEAGYRISEEMLRFLHGAGPLEGVWFGDYLPGTRGRYWWRKRLPEVAGSQTLGEHIQTSTAAREAERNAAGDKE